MIKNLSNEAMSALSQATSVPEFTEHSYLQLFADSAEAVSGKKLIYLYRVLKNQASQAAVQIAFTTENERTKSKDADSTETKDGPIRTPGSAEEEITATSIMKKGDTVIEELEDAMDADGLVEVWEANLDNPGTGSNKFKGRYFRAYITEMTFASSAEDFVEVSLTFGVTGTSQKGDVTVTTEQQEQASYVFTDTTAAGA